MKTFPAFYDLDGKKVVIAGSGEMAARKARLVAAAGAKVVFVGRPDQALRTEWPHADFVEEGDADAALVGAALAFIAETDGAAAECLVAAARAARVPVNVVDRPDLSDFLTPSIIDRGDVVVAVSTSGAAPVLARRIRERIEALLPARLSSLAVLARAFRKAVSSRIPASARRLFWEHVVDGPIAERALAGDEKGAREAMIEAINRPQTEQPTGVVHIIGAGPGDPDLLTLRALRLLSSADVILYDRLAGEGVLKFARRDALFLPVGKAKGDHSVPQDEIERRLIEYARQGKTVVRLKGGDPFIFGRGGEELEAVKAAGIPVFVTPGITAATGCAAAAGVPLTERDLSQAVTFVTGHAKEGAEPDLDWRALAALKHTLVVYMGVARAEAISGSLIAAGRDPATPVAIVESGTTPRQRVFKGVLRELGALVDEARIASPALLIIGEVAARADGLSLAEIAELQRRAA